MIPASIVIQQGALPSDPGVYLMKDATGAVLYVGKAVSLKRRVEQHFSRPHNLLIQEMTPQVRAIDYLPCGTALEALILEARLIKFYWPKYNTAQKDNKSFLYLVFTKDVFPKPLLVRGNELREASVYKAVFGPFTSPRALRAALDLLRKPFPWTTCEPHQKKPCFYVHLGLCPGVCIDQASQEAYQKVIRDLIRFFQGKKDVLIRQLRKEMLTAAKEKRFEEAAELRNRLFALEHIKDIAILKREDEEADKVRDTSASIHFLGRVEGYDISHISGTATVASMVVFEEGLPVKSEYRTFRIRSVQEPNDVASLRETIMRRFRHDWKRPDVLLIDGGLAQVHAVEQVLHELNLAIPVIGMAKGAARKRTDLVCSLHHQSVCEAARAHQKLLTDVRDEAHRFAIRYHRVLRRSQFLPSSSTPRSKKPL